MASHLRERLTPTPASLRLETLLRLRWLSAIGQLAAILIAHFVLDVDIPTLWCLLLVGASVLLNVVLQSGPSTIRRLGEREATALLAVEIVQLAGLLALTGGLTNPFSVLLISPVAISAFALPPRATIWLTLLVLGCATVIGIWHLPIEWSPGQTAPGGRMWLFAVWSALLIAMGFIGIYAFQVAEEARQLSDALNATELVLAREKHLNALDGLAAAAAHELGTPLATIAVVSRELERAMAPDDPHAEDVRLLRTQAQRCRDILGRLTQLTSGDAPFDVQSLQELLEEVAAPHRDFGVTIAIAAGGDGAMPQVRRNPILHYGIGNLIENAVDFAASTVSIDARWDAQEVTVTISDDGPGIAAEILARLGQPFVTSRRQAASGEEVEADDTGLGLGVFIAKTLLERASARLSLGNHPPPAHGARIVVRWPRKALEVDGAPS